MRIFIISKNKYLSNDMKIFGTCSIPFKDLVMLQHLGIEGCVDWIKCTGNTTLCVHLNKINILGIMSAQKVEMFADWAYRCSENVVLFCVGEGKWWVGGEQLLAHVWRQESVDKEMVCYP